MPARRWLATAVVGSTAMVAAACRPGTVQLTAQPRAGTVRTYDIDVKTSSVVHVPGGPARESRDGLRVRERQRVLSVDRSGSRVEITLSAEGEQARVTARLDPSGQLVSVDASSFGGLPLEVLVAKAGLPPHSLRPGERWHTGRTSGRLAGLGVVEGRRVAVLETTSTVPVHGSLSGVQATRSTTRRALADGSIVSSRSHTTGRFRVVVNGVTANLDLDVDALTRMIG